jgi:serine/threonine-protein kinase
MNTIFSTSDWARHQEVFTVAAELSPAERSRYLDAACDPHPALRESVDAWLATLDDDATLNHIVGQAASRVLDGGQPRVGGRLGNYQLTGIAGRGGMGIVYRAIRADDLYRQEVAIKVASQGLLTPAGLQRFLDERQILASLDHPNIARIMDGGSTPDGAPYLVMEFVSGKPIQVWCDEARLGVRERVILFIQVCRAVEHAHRQLVVHRDLKPDNIFVTADGTPKLLDFGIAKVLSPKSLGIDAALTADLERLLTPLNASPEQVLGQAITTSTDVYQLGVLLYQLLTGRSPFKISTARMGEMEELICRTAPPKPDVNEDLDGIILHAIEKEPARRYASVSELANDLERYLNGFPVSARGPSWRYQAGKFVARHKLTVSAGLSALVLLASFSVVTLVQSRRIERERRTAEKVADLQSSIFSAADPHVARGRVSTARDLLDRGAASIDRTPGLDPVVKDRLLNTMATAYRSLSEFDRAYEMFSRSLEIRKRLYGERSPQVAETLGLLADLDIFSEDYRKAFQDGGVWFATIRPIDGRYDAEALAALKLRATLENYQNRLPAAEATGREAIAVASKVFGANSPQAFEQYTPLGNLLYRAGKWADAEQTYRKALAFYRRGSWQDSPAVDAEMETATRLGYLLTLEGRYAEAEPLLRETLALRLKILGFAHDSTGATEAALGFVLGKMHHTAEAEKLGRDSLRSREAAGGGTSRNYGVDESLLATTYLEEGKVELAAPLLENDVMLVRAHLGEPSLFVARELNKLGQLQLARRQLDAAANTLQSALAMEIETNGGNSPHSPRTICYSWAGCRPRKASCQRPRRTCAVRLNSSGRPQATTTPMQRWRCGRCNSCSGRRADTMRPGRCKFRVNSPEIA